MSLLSIFLIVLCIAIAGHFAGRSKALSSANGKASGLHSLPAYYGTYVLSWALFPPMALMALWLVISPSVISNAITSTFPVEVQSLDPAKTSLIYGTVESIADGLRQLNPDQITEVSKDISLLKPLLAENGIALASDGEAYMVTSALTMISTQNTSRLLLSIFVIGISLLCAFYAYRKIEPRFRARNRVERFMLAGLIAASTIAILTTLGIFASMVTETGRFFSSVPPTEFFFGITWDPRFASAGDTGSAGQFGLIPLLAGTLYIALVAMLVAVPIGLYAAIYMAEYASPTLRSIAKPLLEVLAGIPTIVYGFFALVTVGPFLRDISAQIAGIATGDVANFIQAQSVLTAGLVMGIMLIPFVSSLSDDIITQVPGAMRDGSLGIGATRSETVRRVILPAALPGIVGALLLTASRAIGETMIVVLAAGIAARISINPFEPMTTVTVKIVSQLTGDLEFTSPQTLVAFALGMTLFFLTLGLNVYALYIVRKYREQYE